MLSQVLNEEEEKIFYLSRSDRFEINDSILFLNKKVDTDVKLYYLSSKSILENFAIEDSIIKITRNLLDKKKYSKNHLLKIILADHALYSSQQNDSIAITEYRSILENSIIENNHQVSCEVLKRLLEFLSRNGEERDLLQQLVERYIELAYDENEMAYAQYYSLALKMISNDRDGKNLEINDEVFRKILDTSKKIKNKILQAKTYQLLGVKYWGFDRDYLLAMNSYDKAKDIYVGMDNDFSKAKLMGILINSAAIHLKESNPFKALESLKKAEQIQLPSSLMKDYVLLYENLAKSYIQLKHADSSLFYLEKRNRAESRAKSLKHAKTIAELDKKYQTAEKEKQILIEKQRATTNRNWLIVAAITLLLGSGVAMLLQKNTTKKRKLAEQQQFIEQQKVATLLKEQELKSIDAMIAGQEKERTKVANELHDDLGSLMATVKLHFDNVKVDQKDPALKNAQKLLDEAYQKIRGMAHAKNSGVMANQGLLPAVKKMARTINETNALEVTVEDFGLGDRMENSLELTIFRIIQELIANIIKHAQATKANIQFTQYESNLNIIIEDNGNGFDMAAIKRTQNGMGLGTIEKRIEHLEGTFTVDSVLEKGTSILIDIPV